MAYNPIKLGPTTTANSQAVVLPSDQTAIPVTGTFYQATQPVSLASLPALAIGSNAIGSITNTTFAATSATATSLKAQAENYQGGAAVSNTNPLYVTAIATNANGYSVATGSIGNTKTDIGTANTAGVVAGWYFYNPNNSVAYVQVFNLQASAVTLGTTAPTYSIGVPALSAANLMSPTGVTHSTAISIAVTTTRAGLTNVGSTVDYNIFYKQ